jgi:3-hydroxybutyryl-CoA dehydrogenase
MGQMESSEIQGVIARIQPVVGLDLLTEADLIMETISEDLDVKKAFYAETARLCAHDAIVTSNTSYLNIFELAPETLQERLLITHFFAPPYLIPLVEIVKGPKTLPEVARKMYRILLQTGNKPIIMEKFIPGFIVNRLQRAVGREIFHLMDGGYAKPEEIDKAVLASLGIRIPVLGVVRRYDFGGLDLASKMLSNPSIGLVNEDVPSKTLEDLVSKGHLGVKTGKGFYDYEGETQEDIYRKRDKSLIRIRNLVNEIEELWKK